MLLQALLNSEVGFTPLTLTPTSYPIPIPIPTPNPNPSPTPTPNPHQVGFTPALFYEQLLPFLNKRPTRANLPSEYGPGSCWLGQGLGSGLRLGLGTLTLT